MEFMGISVGILALVATCMLLFGRRGTLKILGVLMILVILGTGGTVGFIIWQERHKPVEAQSADGVIHEFPAGISRDVIDRVMKDYAQSSPLAKFRLQYPQYNDLSDAALADALYRKFYSDMPRVEFDKRVGLAPDDADAKSVISGESHGVKWRFSDTPPSRPPDAEGDGWKFWKDARMTMVPDDSSPVRNQPGMKTFQLSVPRGQLGAITTLTHETETCSPQELADAIGEQVFGQRHWAYDDTSKKEIEAAARWLLALAAALEKPN
jgi:hypothetical protein